MYIKIIKAFRYSVASSQPPPLTPPIPSRTNPDDSRARHPYPSFRRPAKRPAPPNTVTARIREKKKIDLIIKKKKITAI